MRGEISCFKLHTEREKKTTPKHISATGGAKYRQYWGIKGDRKMNQVTKVCKWGHAKRLPRARDNNDACKETPRDFMRNRNKRTHKDSKLLHDVPPSSTVIVQKQPR